MPLSKLVYAAVFLAASAASAGENGPHWFVDVEGSDFPSGIIQGLADQEGTLACLTSMGLFQSADSGRSWTAQPGPARDYGRAGRLLRGWNGLLISDASGIWFRGRLQEDWTSILSSPGGAYDTLFASDSLIALAGAGKALLRGRGDPSWKTVDSLPGKVIGLRGRSLYAAAGLLFHISDDAGATWRATEIPDCRIGEGAIPNRILGVLTLGDTLAVFQTYPVCYMNSPAKVHLSQDGGRTWTTGNTGTAFAPMGGTISSMQSGDFAWWQTDRTWIFRGAAGESMDLAGKPLSLAYSGGRLFAAYWHRIMWTDAFGNGNPSVIPGPTESGRGGLPRLILRTGHGGARRVRFTVPRNMTVVLTGFDTRGRALFSSAPLRVAAGPVDWPLPKIGPGPCIMRLSALP
jgi:hypothetical protein